MSPIMPAYQGICLIEIERVQAAEKRFAEHFLKRIFTPGELDYCGAGAARPQRLAARFAAKASVRAALRQAGLPPLPYHLIEIERDEWGMPHLKAPIGVTPGIGILISLSHTRTLAAACAAIVQDTGDRRG